MNSTVKVVADTNGNVIRPSNNPDWGFVRVVQVRNVVDDRGFARRKQASALIHGTVEDLKGFGYKHGQEIEGKIIFKEQLTPFNTKNPERDLKIAGDTKVVCCVDGAPIYRSSFYAQNPLAQDVLLAHTNGEEIKAAYAEINKEEAL